MTCCRCDGVLCATALMDRCQLQAMPFDVVRGRCVTYVMSAGGCTLCARDAGAYASCAALYAGGCGRLCLLEVLGWMRRVRLCMPEAVGVALFSRGVGGIGGAGGDAMCAALYTGGCGGLCLLEVLEVCDVLEVLGWMRRVRL